MRGREAESPSQVSWLVCGEWQNKSGPQGRNRQWDYTTICGYKHSKIWSPDDIYKIQRLVGSRECKHYLSHGKLTKRPLNPVHSTTEHMLITAATWEKLSDIHVHVHKQGEAEQVSKKQPNNNNTLLTITSCAQPFIHTTPQIGHCQFTLRLHQTHYLAIVTFKVC